MEGTIKLEQSSKPKVRKVVIRLGGRSGMYSYEFLDIFETELANLQSHRLETGVFCLPLKGWQFGDTGLCTDH